jgi:hypothetical protein
MDTVAIKLDSAEAVAAVYYSCVNTTMLDPIAVAVWFKDNPADMA